MDVHLTDPPTSHKSAWPSLLASPHFTCSFSISFNFFSRTLAICITSAMSTWMGQLRETLLSDRVYWQPLDCIQSTLHLSACTMEGLICPNYLSAVLIATSKPTIKGWGGRVSRKRHVISGGGCLTSARCSWLPHKYLHHGLLLGDLWEPAWTQKPASLRQAWIF